MADMTLEEALAAATVDSSTDSDILTISNNLRTITIPESIKNLGVESDKDVNRIHFKMPKMYKDVDLSEFDIRINYINGNDGDKYIVEDKNISEDYITFSWLVGRNALKTKGSTRFIVCLKKTDSEGIVQKEFNTTLASINVLEGLETTEQIMQKYPDVIEQILKKIEGSTTITPDQISEAVEEYMTANQIQAGATEEQAKQIEKNTQDISKLSDEIRNSTGGITAGFLTALLNCFAKVAWIDSDGQALYDDLELEAQKLISNIKIVSISATYTGGDVASGTQLADLSGVIVYANYSDGSQITVDSGYELSGEIAEGENTITVTYNGYTTTFTVTGLHSSKVYLNFDTIPILKAYYTDDGETTGSAKNASSVIDSNQPVYDRDVIVHFRFVSNFDGTIWTSGYFGSYEETSGTVYRQTGAITYYQEGSGSSYIHKGNVYEGTYTLKAGCYFQAGLFPMSGSIPNGVADIDFTDCYAYIDESEVV